MHYFENGFLKSLATSVCNADVCYGSAVQQTHFDVYSLYSYLLSCRSSHVLQPARNWPSSITNIGQHGIGPVVPPTLRRPHGINFVALGNAPDPCPCRKKYAFGFLCVSISHNKGHRQFVLFRCLIVSWSVCSYPRPDHELVSATNPPGWHGQINADYETSVIFVGEVAVCSQ